MRFLLYHLAWMTIDLIRFTIDLVYRYAGLAVIIGAFFFLLVFGYSRSKEKELGVGGGPEGAARRDKQRIKHIIAREGLVALGIVFIGLILRWLARHPGYGLYSGNVKMILSKQHYHVSLIILFGGYLIYLLIRIIMAVKASKARQ